MTEVALKAIFTAEAEVTPAYPQTPAEPGEHDQKEN